MFECKFQWCAHVVKQFHDIFPIPNPFDPDDVQVQGFETVVKSKQDCNLLWFWSVCGVVKHEQLMQHCYVPCFTSMKFSFDFSLKGKY